MKYEDCLQEGQKNRKYLEMEEDIEAGMNPREEADAKTIRNGSKSSVSSMSSKSSMRMDLEGAKTDTKMEGGRRDGGAIKLKEYKKIVLGKERCIYTKKGSKKEYIKHKGEYLTIKEYIKIKSITKRATTATPKKTPATPNKTTATPKKTPATPKKTTATPKKTTATPKKTTATPKKTTATPKKTTATPKRTPATPKKTQKNK
jgi:hypothetical protein